MTIGESYELTVNQDGRDKVLFTALYIGPSGTDHIFSLRPLAGTQVVPARDLVRVKQVPGRVVECHGQRTVHKR